MPRRENMHRKPKPSQREEPKPAHIRTRRAPGSARVRAVRVFVSSTFLDMQAERDELVKRVFPQLRKLCERRGVSWGEVDLRWGITDEQRAEGRVLPVCLEEIRRCRPFFIGLLGERYGSVPDAIDPELTGREPWLKGQAGTSVTELEILHGVLNKPERAKHSFFYLREPGYVASLPQDQQPAFREAGEGAEERREKLAALKARIRSSRLPVRDYASPQSAGALILKDLTSVIDPLYPAGSEPDPLQREAAEHEAFARSRTGVYIGSTTYFEALDAHAAGDGPPLVVLGESGSGKSALFANWALGYRTAHPDHAVVMHFIGSSPQSSDWAAMLRRVMAELGHRFGIDATIPDTAEELRAAFPNWLHMAAARGRVILLLDALNQLEDRDGAPDLVWLPPQIPAGVRLIVSTLPGRPLEELGRRRWPVMEVEPLTLTQREELIGEYLGQYRKELSRPQAQQIARAWPCANPLFLRVLLEGLRLWGEHQTLGECIGHYLAASTIPALYQLVLGRWEADYERERRGLVGEAMSLLWAARQGLSEAELLDLLGADGQPLPAAYWSPFSLAAEQSLGGRAGLIGFAHDYLRQAARTRYLSTEDQQQAAHLRLADYFDSRRDQPRGVIELPWQLAKARAWTALSQRLADPGFFNNAWEASRFDVQGYWAQIEAGSPLRMAEVYRPVIDQPEADGKHALEVGQLLRGAGHLDATLTLNGHLADHYRARGNMVGLSSCLGNQGLILSDRGQLDDAMAVLKEQEQISREFGDQHGLQLCLGNQGNILFLRGDLDAAMTLHKEEERICRGTWGGDKTSLQRSGRGGLRHPSVTRAPSSTTVGTSTRRWPFTKSRSGSARNSGTSTAWRTPSATRASSCTAAGTSTRRWPSTWKMSESAGNSATRPACRPASATGASPSRPAGTSMAR